MFQLLRSTPLRAIALSAVWHGKRFTIAKLLSLTIFLQAAGLSQALTFEDWQEQTSGAGSTADANRDGDLFNDLQEYAFGTDPASGDTSLLGADTVPSGIVTERLATGGTAWRISFWRPKLRTDVNYELYYSLSSGDNWQKATLTSGSPVLESNDVAERINLHTRTQPATTTILWRMSATVDFHGTVFSHPLGVQLATGGNATTTQSFGLAFPSIELFCSTVQSFTASTIQARSLEPKLITSKFEAESSYYLEFIEGPMEGHRIGIDVANSSGNLLALDFTSESSTADGLVAEIGGTRFLVFRNKTLGEVFPKTHFKGTSSSATADRVSYRKAGTLHSFWRFQSGANDKWCSTADATLDDVSNLPIHAGMGFFVIRKVTPVVTINVFDVGRVPVWTQARVVPVGNTLFSSHATVSSRSPSWFGLDLEAGCNAEATSPYGDQIVTLPYENGTTIQQTSVFKLVDPVAPAAQWVDSVSEADVTTSNIIRNNRTFTYNNTGSTPFHFEVPTELPSSAAAVPHNPLFDQDDDSLPDEWELEYFADSTSQVGSSDFDNDGVSNLLEYLSGTDPTGDGDSDFDGLNDAWEILNGLNPFKADTDGDEIPDGWETSFGLEPTDPTDAQEDPDGDHRNNLREYQLKTAPLVANAGSNFLPKLSEEEDGDQDLLPDSWEHLVAQTNGEDEFRGPADITPDADPDGDMLTNCEEYANGTNPLDPADGLEFEVAAESGHGFARANGFPSFDGSTGMYSTKTSSGSESDSFFSTEIYQTENNQTEHIVHQANQSTHSRSVVKPYPIITGQLLELSPDGLFDEISISTSFATGTFDELLSAEGGFTGFRTIYPNPVSSNGPVVEATIQDTLWGTQGMIIYFGPNSPLAIMSPPSGGGILQLH